MASLASPSNSRLTCLANGTTYDSVLIEPKQNNPYILFLHGFPASSYDWRHQIAFFSDLGYGVFAPDLLGYGGTDKPSQLEAYKLKQMSEDIVSLLDHHDIKEAIGVGHDWYISSHYILQPPASHVHVRRCHLDQILQPWIIASCPEA